MCRHLHRVVATRGDLQPVAIRIKSVRSYDAASTDSSRSCFHGEPRRWRVGRYASQREHEQLTAPARPFGDVWQSRSPLANIERKIGRDIPGDE